jgi:hypothetical protein
MAATRRVTEPLPEQHRVSQGEPISKSSSSWQLMSLREIRDGFRMSG